MTPVTPTTSPARPRLLTIAEVAEKLQLSKQSVTDHANGRSKPVIPRIKIGKSVRFRSEDVDAFILANRECR